MKKRKFTLVLWLISCTLTSTYARSYTKEERIFWLSNIWKDVANNFYAPNYLKAINWDSIYVSFIPKVETASDEKDYYYLLQEFLAKTNDGHTEFSLDAYLKKHEQTDYLPIDVDLFQGKLHITAVRKTEKDNIPLGSEIVRINRMEPGYYMEKYIYPYISAKTEQDKKRKALPFLCMGEQGDSVLFQIETPQNTLKEIYLRYEVRKKRIGKPDMEAFSWSEVNNYRRIDSYPVHTDSGSYYYLRIDHFSNNVAITRLVDREKENINKTDYIVLDLRYNGGGREDKADTLLMCFLDLDTLKTYRSVTRTNHAFFSAMGYGYSRYKEYYNETRLDTLAGDTLVKKGLPLFTQPLYILIGEKTYSAAEDFLLALKRTAPSRAVLIGKPTGGSTGAPLVRPMPGGMYYRICTRFPVPDGTIDLSRGIQPDYYYEPDRKKYMNNRYDVLEFVGALHKKRSGAPER